MNGMRCDSRRACWSEVFRGLVKFLSEVRHILPRTSQCGNVRFDDISVDTLCFGLTRVLERFWILIQYMASVRLSEMRILLHSMAATTGMYRAPFPRTHTTIKLRSNWMIDPVIRSRFKKGHHIPYLWKQPSSAGNPEILISPSPVIHIARSIRYEMCGDRLDVFITGDRIWSMAGNTIHGSTPSPTVK